ncbi:MAG: SDR family oxidoreductase [Ignavibacteriales bacterium]|nr:SDR family oxidoreductase [Ignavibacteriales bacterium]
MADKKKIVWITGASSGIGKALTFEFTRNNIFVIGTARRLELLNRIKKELADYGNNFEPHQLDVTNYAAIDKFHKNILSHYKIDCLINNAGTTSFKKAVDDSIADIENILRVNLFGGIYTIKTVLPGMIKRQSGTIINILSMVTQKVFTSSSAYTASKSGLLGYAKVLREEVRDKNIRVINVLPGATSTEMWSNEIRNKHNDSMMNADDVAKFVFRIFSEKSNMVVEDIILRPAKGDL